MLTRRRAITAFRRKKEYSSLLAFPQLFFGKEIKSIIIIYLGEEPKK
jgi:hypothetical protein